MVAGWDWGDVESVVEVLGVWDGWSIAVLRDGRIINRWAAPGGGPAPGCEARWRATEAAIADMRARGQL